MKRLQEELWDVFSNLDLQKKLDLDGLKRAKLGQHFGFGVDVKGVGVEV